MLCCLGGGSDDRRQFVLGQLRRGQYEAKLIARRVLGDGEALPAVCVHGNRRGSNALLIQQLTDPGARRTAQWEHSDGIDAETPGDSRHVDATSAGLFSGAFAAEFVGRSDGLRWRLTDRAPGSA